MAQKFIWYELMTTDAKAAGAFYREVVGWRTEDASGGTGQYTTFHVGAANGMAGMLELSPEMLANGVPAAWIGYVGVEDVDAAARRLTAAGGQIHREPDDIPGIGRFAVVGDRHDAHFVLFNGMSGEAPPSQAAPGYVGWHELMAGNGREAFAFYADQFGWTQTRIHDMGPMGDYILFAMGGDEIGGIMTKPEMVPRPHWNFYFSVDDAKAAAERLKAAGGTVLNGPMEVPGGDWIVQAMDPQGAMFCLTSRAK